MNSRNEKIKTIEEITEWLTSALELKESISSATLYQTILQKWKFSTNTAKIYMQYFRYDPFVEIAGRIYLLETWQRLEAEREQKEKQNLNDSLLDEELRANEILAIKGTVKPVEEEPANG